MISWLSGNLGTILITLALIGIVVAIVMVMHRDRKKGKSLCGGNCGHCPMGCSCHHGK